MNRRDFIRTSGAGAAALAALSNNAFAAEGDKPLRVALIGCGWYGKTDLLHLMQVAPVEVVALADVDSQMREQAAELVSQRQPSKKKPPLYGDYRKLLAEHKPEICLVGTPDHWHCLPMVEACRAGADVYVQKPISLDVVEGQAMVAAARKYDRTVQVGLQRRNTPHLLQARDRFIASGKLGKVAFVDVHAYGGVLMRKKEDTISDIFDTQTAIFEYPETQVVWTLRHWGENPNPKYPWGATLYGDKGTLKLSIHGYDFIPKGGGQREHADYVDEREKYPEDIAHQETEIFAAPATRAHMRNFLECRQTKAKPTSDIEEGHISSACCIMANLSTDLGRSLKWDAAAGRVVDDDEANARLTRKYRGAWQHPTPENV